MVALVAACGFLARSVECGELVARDVRGRLPPKAALGACEPR